MKKFWRIEKGQSRFTTCPVCGSKNDHMTGKCCNHLSKVTAKGVALYYWGFRPEGFNAQEEQKQVLTGCGSLS